MRLVIALMLLCLAGCAKDLTPGLVGCAEDRSPREDCGKEPTANEHNLTEPKITYLGVGGWLLNWHGNGLLLAPSFSNPNVPIFVRANAQRIADYLPDVKNVKVLLIGHAHYDHLLDVPVIMQRYALRQQNGRPGLLPRKAGTLFLQTTQRRCFSISNKKSGTELGPRCPSALASQWLARTWTETVA